MLAQCCGLHAVKCIRASLFYYPRNGLLPSRRSRRVSRERALIEAEHRVPSLDPVGNKHDTVKRKVALHLGYVGTNFRGLQSQRDPTREDAVEDVLERAIAAMGGILPSNFGSTHRTAWSRSSRTDKGVHSLSTVAAFKMECQDEMFERDPEGLALAAHINEYLPKEIRVFSVQRTHSGFDARHHCRDRSYHYYVPASVLGLTGGSQDAAILERLSACLDTFQGTHPFHNYTERRRYRKHNQQKVKAKARQLWLEKSRRSDAQVTGSSGNGKTDQDFCTADTSSIAGEENGLREMNEAPPAGGRGSKPHKSPGIWWMYEKSDKDQISRAHYRHITMAESSGVLQLTATGEPCLRISFRGSSFMVYQIRHMVAAAVAAATGQIPTNLIPVSLCIHARVAMPLAPPQGLVLADSTFFDFPRAGNGDAHPVARVSGDALSLRKGGESARDAFSTKVLLPAVDEDLRGVHWRMWQGELGNFQYDPSEVDSVLRTYAQWRSQQETRRQDRLAAIKA